ncbi:acetamidase/formamidase family protein [Kocuria rhizophila]|nr:acetamidase/formamidase family protein [Kocuria rhizophila]
MATEPNRVPPALPPEPDSAILGSLTGADYDRVAGEGARTAPPRENGGNQDIKNFTKGSRVLPGTCPGRTSPRGTYFSQGTARSTFCGGIEMGGFIYIHVDVIKGGTGHLRRERERRSSCPDVTVPCTRSGWRSRHAP